MVQSKGLLFNKPQTQLHLPFFFRVGMDGLALLDLSARGG
jgi:hypothetical protein